MNGKISMNLVSQIFESLTGEKSDSAATLLQKSAADTVALWLRSDVSVTKHQLAICTAVAHLAYYRHCLAISSDSYDKFKAGDVTLEEKPLQRVEIAEKLFRSAVQDISPLMKPKRFAFKGV